MHPNREPEIVGASGASTAPARCRPLCAPVLAVAILTGCGSQPEGTSAQSGGTDDFWKRVSPAELGADDTRLAAAIRDVESGEYVNIHSLLVVKQGQLAVEEYFGRHDRDELHEIRSATKVIGSILTGIAIDHGFLRSESDLIAESFEDDYQPSYGWNRRSRLVRISHLLSMTSGYDCDDLGTAFACEHAMYESDDWVQYALDLPFAHDPGEHWAYNSSSLILVGEAIARASGMSLQDFAERYLFGPLGIRGMSWSVSPRGRAWIGGGARMRSREMAKLGLLMLNRGVWNGQRIVSEEWIDKSTAGRRTTSAGVDYGYAWQRAEAALGTRFVPAYWASGNGGQYIVVLPEDGMVVVFTGGNYDSPLANQPFRMLVRDILPAFLKPDAPPEIEPDPSIVRRFAGQYELDLEPGVTSTVSVDRGRLQVATPDGETVDLVAHSRFRFSGESGYGPVTFLFQANDRDEITGFKVYGSFSRFTFQRKIGS